MHVQQFLLLDVIFGTDVKHTSRRQAFLLTKLVSQQVVAPATTRACPSTARRGAGATHVEQPTCVPDQKRVRLVASRGQRCGKARVPGTPRSWARSSLGPRGHSSPSSTLGRRSPAPLEGTGRPRAEKQSSKWLQSSTALRLSSLRCTTFKDTSAPR